MEQGEGGVLGRHAVFDVLLDFGCETQCRTYLMVMLKHQQVGRGAIKNHVIDYHLHWVEKLRVSPLFYCGHWFWRPCLWGLGRLEQPVSLHRWPAGTEIWPNGYQRPVARSSGHAGIRQKQRRV